MAAVEDTAGHLKMPVVIEGYPPPHERALRTSRSRRTRASSKSIFICWLVAGVGGHHHGAVRRCAAIAPGTEKFMLDGRHTGTGGGNHFVFGGPTAADSPFLRRPDLLRSMIGYWLNHPSLSYAFRGCSSGPPARLRGG